ncbi:RNA 2',3'-cyclic phosphodiesterase [Pseudodesulfovibrio sediminis]|uniref:RNA 2',3'-cyclic phosphodiesterase n=1 Tax=Pseudodesulfovibrio sediminis TaxID=2810563 RepID=A0ABN6EUL2_9BACT|nr:RNA 2',3'-cyclic phosphodiesterase [Pseudodesulfovibrio sediminis]BCS88734.1 RNA 2',3'-cyclic phosphodiesterase [Pseudodesulfovibrio sediminis]
MPRLFIGIELPARYQLQVTPFTQTLGTDLHSSVRWSKPGNWHLTLKFLGEIDESRLPRIIEALTAIRFDPFVLQAGGAGVFPRTQHPRVVWLGLKEGAKACTALALQIEDALAPLDIPQEKKQFRPHLTLGRIRRLGRDNWADVIKRAAAHSWPQFTVDRFILWHSALQPEGAVHTRLQECVCSG